MRRVFGDKKADNFDRLKEISGYAKDWNGYGADPIPSIVIDEARHIISSLNDQPDIFPTADRSLQLEYSLLDDSYLEIDIFEDKIVAMQVYGTDYDNAQFWDLSYGDVEQIQLIVSDFINTKNEQ